MEKIREEGLQENRTPVFTIHFLSGEKVMKTYYILDEGGFREYEYLANNHLVRE